MCLDIILINYTSLCCMSIIIIKISYVLSKSTVLLYNNYRDCCGHLALYKLKFHFSLSDSNEFYQLQLESMLKIIHKYILYQEKSKGGGE